MFDFQRLHLALHESDRVMVCSSIGRSEGLFHSEADANFPEALRP